MTFSQANSNLSDKDSEMSEKERAYRERKKRNLEMNQEDQKKTLIIKRSNKLFNKYLKEVDPQL
jgi:hypothetical protein